MYLLLDFSFIQLQLFPKMGSPRGAPRTPLEAPLDPPMGLSPPYTSHWPPSTTLLDIFWMSEFSQGGPPGPPRRRPWAPRDLPCTSCWTSPSFNFNCFQGWVPQGGPPGPPWKHPWAPPIGPTPSPYLPLPLSATLLVIFWIIDFSQEGPPRGGIVPIMQWDLPIYGYGDEGILCLGQSPAPEGLGTLLPLLNEERVKSRVL